MENNAIVEKSKHFARRVVRLYRYLCREKKEYVLPKQLLRCGTSIGANVHEAQRAFSKRDFAAKMSIACKEAAETEFWLDLFHDTEYLTTEEYKSIHADCAELIKLLVAIVKSSQSD